MNKIIRARKAGAGMLVGEAQLVQKKITMHITMHINDSMLNWIVKSNVWRRRAFMKVATVIQNSKTGHDKGEKVSTFFLDLSKNQINLVSIIIFKAHKKTSRKKGKFWNLFALMYCFCKSQTEVACLDIGLHNNGFKVACSLKKKSSSLDSGKIGWLSSSLL